MTEQEELLLVANDAALEGLFDEALRIINQGKPRKILTAFSLYTPESIEDGGPEKTGWLDEDGDEIEIDEDDIEDAFRVKSMRPVTDAFVIAAVMWLKKRYLSQAFDPGAFHPGTWYTSEEGNPYTGNITEKSYHLENFTVEEEKAIFEMLKR